MSQRIAIILIGILAAALSVVWAQDPEVENLLTNGGFDGDFTTHDGAEPRNVAAGWLPWHIPPSDASPSFSNHDPYYDSESDRIRGRDGKAQKFFTLFATHQAGLYQKAPKLSSGKTYRFSVYGYVWSSSFEDARISEDPGDVVLRVGIDPTGGTDGESDDIIWSTSATFFYDAYRQYAVIATAESDSITVFIESTVGSPRANNYIYLDEALLEVASETLLPADDTPTPEVLDSPTPTPMPTDTPVPTATPTPTATPSPTPETVTHIVQEGDTVSALALEYETTIAAIKLANALDERNTIVVGMRLVVPISSFEAFAVEAATATATPSPTPTPPPPTATPTATNTPSPTPTPRPTATPVTYQVRRGDTLYSIALRFGSTVAELAAFNGIVNAHDLDVGQILVISTPTAIPTATPWPTITPTPTAVITGTPPATSADTTTYVVKEGETLSAIAIYFGATTQELVTLNNLTDASSIYPGQVLQVPASGGAVTVASQPTPTLTQITHIVRSGDTLYGISLTYGVSIYELAQTNGIVDANNLDVGQVLIIP